MRTNPRRARRFVTGWWTTCPDECTTDRSRKTRPSLRALPESDNGNCRTFVQRRRRRTSLQRFPRNLANGSESCTGKTSAAGRPEKFSAARVQRETSASAAKGRCAGPISSPGGRNARAFASFAANYKTIRPLTPRSCIRTVATPYKAAFPSSSNLAPLSRRADAWRCDQYSSIRPKAHCADLVHPRF